MNSEQLELFKQNTNIEEFKEFYQTNGFDATREKFGLSHGNLKILVKEWNLYLSQEQRDAIKKRTWAKKETSIENQLNSYIARISYDDLYSYYIIENHSIAECITNFNIASEHWFIRIIDFYNIHKEYSDRVKLTAQTKEEKYGSATYNNREQAIKTCQERYGVSNPFQDRAKMVDSYLNTFGVPHPMQVDAIKNKVISQLNYQHNAEVTKKVCLEKYGVDNPAKLSETKEKIATTLKQTFLNKYGVECYWLMPDAHQSGKSCDSKPNLAFKALLENAQIDYEREVSVNNFRYDFKVGNTLIEINPFPTHNSTWGFIGEPKDKNYHREKTKVAIGNGYRCINVWDWDDLQKIITLLKDDQEIIYGRNTEVKIISKEEAKEFINVHHLQSYCKDEYRYGLFDKNSKLVSVMTFGKPRYNNKFDYELIRYCSSAKIIGGAEKLFQAFINDQHPNSIISYCDYSKFNGETYCKLGFTLSSVKVSKHWFNTNTHEHITDNLLRQRGFDQLLGKQYGTFGKGTSNEQLMLMHDFVEIYDAGQATYTWYKN